MASPPPDPAEPNSDKETHRPSVEDVVARLDTLWDDARAEPPGTLETPIGRQIGRFSILGLIGHGAFGIVYRAFDPQLGRELALKIPRPEVLVDEDKLRRFAQEAQVVAALDHPSIVQVHEADLTGPTPYIALAYVPGPDLAQCLSDLPCLVPWEEAARLVAELAGAVQYAHERGVVHRDLKPSNVLLVPRGDRPDEPASLRDYRPRLTDFGLAKLIQTSLEDTRSSMVIGTPLYTAPEVLLGPASDATDPAADIYSLGCLLYELLAGQPPIVGDHYIQVLDRLRDAQPKRIRKFRPDVPRSLEAVCHKCLEKNPAARYRSAGDLSIDLERAACGDKLAVRPASRFSRFQYWVTRPQRVYDAGWFSLCLNGLAAVWLTILAIVIRRFMDLSDAEYATTVFDAAIAISHHLMLALLGYFTLQRKRWAIWAGLIGSLWVAIFSCLFVTGVAPVFAALYRDDPYHAVSNFMVIFVTAVAQAILYAFALAAGGSTR